MRVYLFLTKQDILLSNHQNIIPMKRLFITTFFLVLAIASQAQMTIVKNSKPVSRIVLADTCGVTQQAASLLQKFVERMSDARLPIVTDAQRKKGDILIGGSTARVGEDGFEIVCHNGSMTIKSGGDKGCILGVAHLLERYFNCDYLTKDGWVAPRSENLHVEAIDWAEAPAFRYRQTQFYGSQDADYKAWYGLEEPRDMFAANMWVHTFNGILPATRFGKEHPEWYSFINGARQPGSHSQWCLTNPEVLEAAAQQLDSIFKANPGMKMISVSQNDGNNTYCHCDKCTELEEYEGAVSGPYIHFMNKLAERFPDKEFSTLAYLFTMQPPKHVKPLPNVNIMLCDIDCKREVPLTDNESGRDFVRAIEGWSKISNNIFVWDYGINFDNQVSPFPNFHILKPNIQLFHRCHANMLFEQVNGAKGTDFSELRAYMLCKLMWNPEADTDSLMRTFCDRYYGGASNYIYQYLKLQQGALLSSGTPLWIYDSPISHKKGMLNANLIKTYDQLFDDAERAVADDEVLLDRVHLSRLSLQYSKLEIARTEQGADAEALKSDLKLFDERTSYFGVASLNERRNSPQDYCKLYVKRFLPQSEKNLAEGCKVTFIKAPGKQYQPIADKALTDGLYGGSSYVESWVGWCGEDAEFIIDLGKDQLVSSISTDFLHQLGAWILLPKAVSYEISLDGTHYDAFGSKFTFAEDRDLSIKYVEGRAEVCSPQKARFIRVKIDTIGMCPSWHYGIGYPAWFFCDEVVVR